MEDLIDRAIGYTNRILQTMPNYEDAALAGLRKLRDALARKSPDDPALKRLDTYIESLASRPPAPP